MDLGDEFAGGYWGLPVVTRVYLTTVGIVAVLAHFNYVSTLDLYYNHRLVFHRHQYWRLLTNFLFFGSINFDFLFHIFFMTKYFRLLEEQSFHRKPADFLYLLVFGSALLLLIGTAMHITFLSAALSFMIIYVWARRNPAVIMNFLGLINFPAPYMPFVLLGFSFLLTGSLPKSDALGIIVGHLYYYFKDIYPRASGKHPLDTPNFMYPALFCTACLHSLANTRKRLLGQPASPNASSGNAKNEADDALRLDNLHDDEAEARGRRGAHGTGAIAHHTTPPAGDPDAAASEYEDASEASGLPHPHQD